MHNRLVGLVLEIRLPTTSEVWSGPSIHLLEFFLSRTNLDTCVDTISSQWPGTLDVPLIKDSLLNFWHASDEVIE